MPLLLFNAEILPVQQNDASDDSSRSTENDTELPQAELVQAQTLNPQLNLRNLLTQVGLGIVSLGILGAFLFLLVTRGVVQIVPNSHSPSSVDNPSRVVLVPTYTPTPSPAQTHTPTVTPTAFPTSTPQLLFLVSSDANLRTGPGTTYSVVGAAKSGDSLLALGYNSTSNWVYLNDGSWVYGDLGVLATATPIAIPPTVTATYTPTPVATTPAPATSTSTYTPVPPTATFTVSPTFTPTRVPPTATPIPPTPTYTRIPPTATYTPTPTPLGPSYEDILYEAYAITKSNSAKTSAQVDAEWSAFVDSLIGESVYGWEGWVTDVREGFFWDYAMKIDLQHPSLGTQWDVLCPVSSEQALQFHRGQKVRISGTISYISHKMLGDALEIQLESITVVPIE